MFRLPIPNYRIIAEFHFGIAHLLLAAIAGISTTLYEQSGSSGGRFRGVLLTYYPFALEPVGAAPADVAARTLWSVFRNSLAHDLGFDLEKHAKTPQFKLLRVFTRTGAGTRGLTEKLIARLEDTSARPNAKPTVVIRPDATVLSVDALYWGVRNMVEVVLNDSKRVHAAEGFLASL